MLPSVTRSSIGQWDSALSSCKTGKGCALVSPACSAAVARKDSSGVVLITCQGVRHAGLSGARKSIGPCSPWCSRLLEPCCALLVQAAAACTRQRSDWKQKTCKDPGPPPHPPCCVFFSAVCQVPVRSKPSKGKAVGKPWHGALCFSRKFLLERRVVCVTVYLHTSARQLFIMLACADRKQQGRGKHSALQRSPHARLRPDSPLGMTTSCSVTS